MNRIMNSSNSSLKNKWSRDELILAFNLYCKTPFGKIHHNNKDIISLASIIKRSPSAVSLKLSNFARLDPALQERNIAGMSHGSKSEVDVWEEFNNNWEALAYQSESILAHYRDIPLEESAKINNTDLPPVGKERESLIKIRVNQSFFRQMVMASYDSKCCVTGISVPELLVAGHIVPWSVDESNRLNPCNGLCLNSLHDAAFDKGLMTITPEYRIKLSSVLKEDKNTSLWFNRFDGAKITLPKKFVPSTEFIEYHHDHVFKG
ncbi:MAG: HNH endonuclease [Dehalogenimonas sp.]|uniref:HNH endonuclease n=1 Tax=Candidatus Dehalogenimonas loeffleri TaxID=3127115 RepID=A0ABZ2JB98_9CHLR|nr:HNH endonuclease [Dehalogenimonas sp.]